MKGFRLDPKWLCGMALSLASPLAFAQAPRESFATNMLTNLDAIIQTGNEDLLAKWADRIDQENVCTGSAVAKSALSVLCEKLARAKAYEALKQKLLACMPPESEHSLELVMPLMTSFFGSLNEPTQRTGCDTVQVEQAPSGKIVEAILRDAFGTTEQKAFAKFAAAHDFNLKIKYDAPLSAKEFAQSLESSLKKICSELYGGATPSDGSPIGSATNEVSCRQRASKYANSFERDGTIETFEIENKKIVAQYQRDVEPWIRETNTIWAKTQKFPETSYQIYAENYAMMTERFPGALLNARNLTKTKDTNMVVANTSFHFHEQSNGKVIYENDPGIGDGYTSKAKMISDVEVFERRILENIRELKADASGVMRNARTEGPDLYSSFAESLIKYPRAIAPAILKNLNDPKSFAAVSRILCGAIGQYETDKKFQEKVVFWKRVGFVSAGIGLGVAGFFTGGATWTIAAGVGAGLVESGHEYHQAQGHIRNEVAIRNAVLAGQIGNYDGLKQAKTELQEYERDLLSAKIAAGMGFVSGITALKGGKWLLQSKYGSGAFKSLSKNSALAADDLTLATRNAAREFPTTNPELLVRYTENAAVVNAEYAKKSAESVAYFDQWFTSGKESYESMLKRMHGIAAYKDKAYAGKIYAGTANAFNKRDPSYVKLVAEKFDLGDLKDGRMAIDGIPESIQPLNTFSNGSHIYPHPQDVKPYVDRASEVLEKIRGQVKSGKFDNQAVQDQIGEYYYYMINARPFAKVNNSMFMNQVNYMLRLTGHTGIPHGEIDHLLIRLNSAQARAIWPKILDGEVGTATSYGLKALE